MNDILQKHQRESSREKKSTVFLWLLDTVGIGILLFLDGLIYGYWPEPSVKTLKIIGAAGGLLLSIILHLAFVGLILLDTSSAKAKSNAIKGVICMTIFPFGLFVLRLCGVIFP